MLRRNWELLLALAAVLVVTGLYWLAYRQAGTFPAAYGLIGHGIGVIGFVLMLMTETLYSIRKQVDDARWGAMASWLRFHIFTGLVGPYMVLLHTAMRFQGLAGVAMLLTVVVVASGMVGRYLYTAVPRVPGDDQLEGPRPSLLAKERGALATWMVFHVPLTWALFMAAFVHAAAAAYYATLQR